MPYCRPVPTQARQQADSSEGGFAKVAPLPIDHFLFFIFFIFYFCFPLGFPGLGLDMRWSLMVDTTSGLKPVNTGFNLEVMPSLNTCSQGRAIVLKLIYNNFE